MKKTMEAETARDILDYDPETGLFTWKIRPLKYFRDEWHFKSWNTKMAGKPAMMVNRSNGYKATTIFGVPWLAHRVAWLIHYGYLPDEIDHINGDRTDNRITNLRSVTRKENLRNLTIPVTNSSGVVGVFLHKKSGRWYTRIGKTYLGMFPSFEEAVAVRKEAEKAHGYHPNHGKQAVHKGV